MSKIKIFIYRSKNEKFRHISVEKWFLKNFIYRSIFDIIYRSIYDNFNIDRYMVTYFEKYKCTWFARLPNFVMLKFYTPFDTHDLLLLNLITRKLFWMGSKNIETKIRDKVPGRLPNFRFLANVMNRPHAVLVEDKRFVIKYIIHSTVNFDRLGWFLELRIYIIKLYTNYM